MIRRALAGLLIVVLIVLALLLALGFRPAQLARMFGYPVTGGPTERVEAAAAAPAAPVAESPPRAFGAANYAVLGAYLAGMLAVGFVAGRRISTTRSFFIADGRLNYLVVGLSILGTYLSALSMMGLSGAAYGVHDWTYMVQLPFLVITAAVITRFVLPRYRDAGIISIYEFLETRIHTSARVVASLSFILFAIGRMGLVLYLPALAFSTATGASLPLCILVMGLIVTIYTVAGGMEAVVWTDAIQVAVFVAAAALTLGRVFADVSAEQFVSLGMAHGKFRYAIPSLSLYRITTVWLILETVFQTIRIYGTQQDIAQRYMTTGSTAKAARSVWIGILAYIPLGFVFYFIGTALFVYYKAFPQPDLPAKADSMYPYFIMHELPAGVAGLVIAAIFAAAMSSIDSCMNSASTVCIEDFIKRFRRSRLEDRAYLRIARLLTVLWGVLTVSLALRFISVQYAQIMWGKVMGVSTNGMLGLMALAFLPFRIDWRAALFGVAVAYGYLYAMMQVWNVNFLLWPVVGNTVCFVGALLLHRLLHAPATEKHES